MTRLISVCLSASPTLWYLSTAGKLHPNINLDDPEDMVDTSILVGPQAEDVDVKARTALRVLLSSFGSCSCSIRVPTMPVRNPADRPPDHPFAVPVWLPVSL